MSRRLSFGTWLTGVVNFPMLAALMLTQSQFSQGHSVSGNPQEQRLLPRENAESLFPSLLAMRDIGPRRDEGEVEEKSITLDLGGGVKLELVRIPAGTFLMGSPEKEEDRFDDEGPQHRVEITQPFYMGKYEVTQEQYERVQGINPSWFTSQWALRNMARKVQTNRYPVESVLWEDAVRFCEKLSQRDGRRHKFRLPTEAEWEYACRAGTSTPFHFGKVLNGKQANCDGREPYGTEEKGPDLERPEKVGSYRANSWGLFDMHGNVWEWCQDWYARDYYANSSGLDPQGPKRGQKRVVRGGCWCLKPIDCRAADRGKLGPKSPYEFVGFRVAFSPD